MRNRPEMLEIYPGQIGVPHRPGRAPSLLSEATVGPESRPIDSGPKRKLCYLKSPYQFRQRYPALVLSQAKRENTPSVPEQARLQSGPIGILGARPAP